MTGMPTRHLIHTHAPSFLSHARPPPPSDVAACQAFQATPTSQQMTLSNLCYINFNNHRRLEVVCFGMLSPRKFMQKRKKIELFKDAAHEADQKNWRKLMLEIDETGSAVPVLRSRKASNDSLPKDLVLGTLVRLKQLKKWNLVSEILEWLRTQQWWDFNEMDFVMLITAYGKQGDFVKAENIFSFMNKKGYTPNVVSYTALMEAYGKGGQYSKAESVFRRMQTSGPEPSALTYQIILKIFVEGNKFEEAEQIFENLTNDEKSPLKPDQKMFHMMIYMHKKAGSYEKAHKLFCLMAERGIQRSTVTFNSLMSFETNYKEVSRIYDQMQKAGLRPDVVSYALLIHAYGKARREEEASAVFEEMLDAGVRPTHKAYNILLDAFAISGMVEQARNVFKCMRRDRFTPDLCSYTSMLSAYINASDMDGAEKFFKRLRVDKLQPNVVTYGTLLKGYAKVNNLEKMMETYEDMITHGIKANQTILTTMMDGYGKNKDFASAVHWYKEMDNRGCPPDQKAKNILLSLAKTEEEQEEANQLVGSNASYQTPRFSNYSSDDINEVSDESDDDYSDDETELYINSDSSEIQDELIANKSS
ncbi:pentatricopeptide repeat-containing protein At3g59040-like isoform X2 [Chenopodium quinoa]|uniref:pentatricopeptide repeat-containing protein At3g59040-like isoform X2 n=1 Tax=Chenopodium quinoa TaxID=63459 RepID=UPI000B77800F|nr:pentatricopeptide repeat-containing protein At3g59040-like isoform X2 [Chenopodium quinoa]